MADRHADRELLEYLQSVVTAFEATSDNFEQELGARMGKHLSSVMKKNEPVLVRPLLGGDTALTKAMATIVENINRPRTPKIPGVNSPKEGLGAAPKAEKPKKERPVITKKKVYETEADRAKIKLDHTSKETDE